MPSPQRHLCWLTVRMTELPHEIDIDGTPLRLLDTDADIACWSGELVGEDAPAVSIVIDPAGPPTTPALEAAGVVVAEFDGLVAAASDFLVSALGDGSWPLDDSELALLRGAEPPFALPEAVIWDDGSWMLRFAESPLAMGEDYGIGVLFAGRTPVAVEDLSDAEEEPSPHGD